MDADTGQVLFYNNDKKRLYPAGTTKILTALFAIEEGNLKDMVSILRSIKYGKIPGNYWIMVFKRKDEQGAPAGGIFFVYI